LLCALAVPVLILAYGVRPVSTGQELRIDQYLVLVERARLARQPSCRPTSTTHAIWPAYPR
jgi:hypothetical protein